jgi:hypothetical protein
VSFPTNGTLQLHRFGPDPVVAHLPLADNPPVVFHIINALSYAACGEMPSRDFHCRKSWYRPMLTGSVIAHSLEMVHYSKKGPLLGRSFMHLSSEGTLVAKARLDGYLRCIDHYAIISLARKRTYRERLVRNFRC